MITAVVLAVHDVAAVAAMAVVAINLVMAAIAAVRGGQPPAAYRPLHRATAGLIAVAIVAGVVLYAGQRRPHSDLHLVYAAAALLTMPVARALVRRDRGRARWYQVGGTLLLLGVIFRLVTTG